MNFFCCCYTDTGCQWLEMQTESSIEQIGLLIMKGELFSRWGQLKGVSVVGRGGGLRSPRELYPWTPLEILVLEGVEAEVKVGSYPLDLH